MDRPRESLIARVPAFATVPPGAVASFSRLWSEAVYPAGTLLTREGEPGDRCFLLMEGQAAVSLAGTAGPIPMGSLEPGELLGELGLLLPGGLRRATVTALVTVRVLELSARDFAAFLEAYPEVRESLLETATMLVQASLLKRSSPFGGLSVEDARRFGSRMRRVAFPAGTLVVRQGEPGDRCYLVTAGELEVFLVDESGQDCSLATLTAGNTFGEAALLTGSPRNASVRALSAVEMLELSRADLLDLLGRYPEFKVHQLTLLRLRDRPLRRDGVEIHRRLTPGGEPLTILKNPSTHTYYRLSERGWFVWERLDGRHNLKQIALQYLSEFKSFAPHVIAEIVAGLAMSGFLETHEPLSAILGAPAPSHWRQRILLAVARLMEWRWVRRDVDVPFGRLYHRLAPCLGNTGRAALALFCAAGLTAFWSGSGRVLQAWENVDGWVGVAMLVFAFNTLALFFHECGHALATKACGRQVNGIGLGLHRFLPIAFVDTSDIWLADRRSRIAVSLAGPLPTWPWEAWPPFWRPAARWRPILWAGGWRPR